MERRPLKTRQKIWPGKLARCLLRAGLTPNAVSLLSVVFACGAAFLLTWRAWCWGGLLLAAGCIQLRLLCNLLDGLMAVEGGAKSPVGELFNELPDRPADVLILTAAGYGAGMPWLGWLASCLALVTAYLRAFGASLGHGQDFCGPGAKPQRMFFLTMGCLGQSAASLAQLGWPVLAWALALTAALTAATVVRRTLRLAGRLRSQ